MMKVVISNNDGLDSNMTMDLNVQFDEGIYSTWCKSVGREKLSFYLIGKF